MHLQEDDPTSTTVDLTTSSELLVPGDGTEGAESTTTTVESGTLAADDDGLSDAALITMVIVGLLVVAALVGVLTWRYWVATRPDVGDSRERADSVDVHG